MKQLLILAMCCLIYSAQAQKKDNFRIVRGFKISNTAVVDTSIKGMMTVTDHIPNFGKMDIEDSVMMVVPVWPTSMYEGRPIDSSSSFDFWFFFFIAFALWGPLPMPLIRYIARKQLEKQKKNEKHIV